MTELAAPERSVRKPRLGEELPVFCEKCGYSLHALPQVRCEQCSVLQFHCPECGHHQPINTLRPAVQRVLGRVRASMLIGGVLFRIAFFGFLLIGWGGMGSEWSYRYWYSPVTQPRRGGSYSSYSFQTRTATLDADAMAAFICLGLGFGMVGRMLLLRWKRGVWVGAVLAVLVFAAVLIGARLRKWDLRTPVSPFTKEFLLLAGMGIASVVLGAIIVWPIWSGIVRLFLPKRMAEALLDWQCWREEKVSGLVR